MMQQLPLTSPLEPFLDDLIESFQNILSFATESEFEVLSRKYAPVAGATLVCDKVRVTFIHQPSGHLDIQLYFQEEALELQDTDLYLRLIQPPWRFREGMELVASVIVQQYQ